MNTQDHLVSPVPSEDLQAALSVRDAFEAWYCRHFMQECGGHMLPEEIADKRKGDGYGDHRGYLNGCWQTYKALHAIPADNASPIPNEKGSE